MLQNKVKAAVMTGPGRIESQDFPYPEIGDDAMVIALEMCGICGTDKRTYRGETIQYGGTPAEKSTPLPIIPGHEIVGAVAEIGRRARTRLEYHSKELSVGDRAVMCPDILCGRCHYCRNFSGFPLCENIRGYGNHFTSTETPHLMGGWAEHIYVRPDAFVYKAPDGLDAELAVMTELMAVTYNLDKAKSFYSMDGEGFGSGASIAVQGVGPMGLLHVFKARIMGAGDIIALDRSDYRLAVAKKFGADFTINVTGLTSSEIIERVRDLTEGRGADIALEHRCCRSDPSRNRNGAQGRHVHRRRGLRRRRHGHAQPASHRGAASSDDRHVQPPIDGLRGKPQAPREIPAHLSVEGIRHAPF